MRGFLLASYKIQAYRLEFFTRKNARKPRPHAPPRHDGQVGDESQPKKEYFLLGRMKYI
jgi:hypothetical protein